MVPQRGALRSARLFYVVCLSFFRNFGCPSLLWNRICSHFRSLNLHFLCFSGLHFSNMGERVGYTLLFCFPASTASRVSASAHLRPCQCHRIRHSSCALLTVYLSCICRPQAFCHQDGSGVSLSRKSLSSAEIHPSLPGQRF